MDAGQRLDCHIGDGGMDGAHDAHGPHLCLTSLVLANKRKMVANVAKMGIPRRTLQEKNVGKV